MMPKLKMCKRSHPKEAAAYAKLKRALAEKYSVDRDAYTLEKNNYIEGIVKSARQHFDQSFFIHRSYLIEHDLSLFTLERCTDPCRVFSACCCHRSDDDRSDVPGPQKSIASSQP